MSNAVISALVGWRWRQKNHEFKTARVTQRNPVPKKPAFKQGKKEMKSIHCKVPRTRLANA